MKIWLAYLELTKPRLTSLVVFTSWLGFSLASQRQAAWSLWFHLVFGTWLAAAGASALNQYIERDTDALMRRTQTRPLPQKRLLPRQALWFGLGMSGLGFLQLAIFVNGLSSLLAIFTWGTYLFLYTPMKPKTVMCTLVGAIPGAVPPMIGWSAVQNTLAPQAWVLFSILFLWQLPHFLAIAWMYREDYARAGFPMLPVIDQDGGSTARMIILYSSILIPVTLLPARMGLTSYSYFWGALMLGTAFLLCGVCTAFYRTPVFAKRLLLASVIYLPALLTWLTLSRTS